MVVVVTAVSVMVATVVIVVAVVVVEQAHRELGRITAVQFSCNSV